MKTIQLKNAGFGRHINFYQQGWQLIECLFVILLISILTMWTGNLWLQPAQENKQLIILSTCVSQLTQARLLATTMQKNIVVCGSTDGKTCDGSWSDYWLTLLPKIINGKLTTQVWFKSNINNLANISWDGGALGRRDLTFLSGGIRLKSPGHFTWVSNSSYAHAKARGNNPRGNTQVSIKKIILSMSGRWRLQDVS